MGDQLSQLLEPLAAWFRSFGMPEPIVHWGHPLMMGIVIFVMGSFVGYAGWKGRTSTDEEVALKSRTDHRKLAPLMFLFIALGYTGGVLSLVMQQHSILESPHFWTGTVVVGLLGLNGLISLSGFGGNQASLRTVHAYLGSAALILLFVHALLGINLGVSI
jgi:fucose 4-O-acetylase-like acetyltransferase